MELKRFTTMEEWKANRVKCEKCGSDDDWVHEKGNKMRCLECGHVQK